MNESVDLRLVRLHVEGYGRLRDFVLEPPSRPGIVVRAPNETGKSTLASAIFRGLFGFEDKAREATRRPWEGGPFRVLLEWTLGRHQSCTIVRDFDTQEVLVEWRRASVLVRRWEGSPNPRGRSIDRDAYEIELRQLLGFASRDIFRQIAFVGAADPVRPLAEELLRLLSGGERADHRAALAQLEAGHYEITRQDIEDPARFAKRSPRKLEDIAARRDDLASRAQATRDSHARRRRIEDARAGAQAAIARIEAERDARAPVEEAIRRLREIGREEADAEARRAEVDRALERFADWEKMVREREAGLRPVVRYLRQPPDFADRMGDLERLDGERERAIAEREATAESLVVAPGPAGPALLMLAGVILATGGSLAAALNLVPAAAAGALATAGLTLAVGGGWRERERRAGRRCLESRISEIDEEIARLEEWRREVCEPLGLEMGTLDPSAERHDYELARRLGAQLDGMRETRDALGDRAALERERRALKEERLDLIRLERRRLLDAHPYIGSDSDYERRFLVEGERLDTERARLVEEELRHRRALADMPTVAEDPRRLEAEIARLGAEAERLALERDAFRLAHETLSACGSEFVSVMARRLERRVGRAFDGLTEGRYTAVHIDPNTLDLEVDGIEKMGISAASLSRGAQDQLYFALRAAILEVLASERALPLLLDDPFLHFDADRLARAERTLARLGETHQILLLTHDERLAQWSFPLADLPEPATATASPGSLSGD